MACYKPRNKKELSAIWEELVFLDKETGEALQRFVFDKPYSFLFACADTNELYKKVLTGVISFHDSVSS